MITGEIRRKIGQVFMKDITNIFDDVVFAFICGSVSNGSFTKRSDIDFFTCVKSEVNIYMVNKYYSWYEQVHDMFQMEMDHIYRGEIMTIDELDEKIDLASKEFPHISLKRADIYDAIVWCGMISGEKSFLVGNRNEFKKREMKAARVAEKWKNQIAKELLDMRSDLFLKKIIEYDECA